MGNILQSSYIDVHEAARSGHIDEVRRWVDAGKPVDARDNTQKTPLHYAAQWGQEEALDFLIECGANVNAADFIEDTPLHFACYFGHANCARILLVAGASVSAKDCYGNTPLQIFDDHVTEPVLDEIRYMVREIINGPSRTVTTLPAKAAAATSAAPSSIHPNTNNSAPSLLPSVGLEAGIAVHADGGATRQSLSGGDKNIPSNQSCGLSSPASSSLVGNTPNIQASTPVMLGVNDSSNNTNNNNGGGDIISTAVKPDPSSSDNRFTDASRKGSGPSASARDSRLLPAYALPPPLKIDLPWDEELGQTTGGQAAGGNVSAVMLGRGGEIGIEEGGGSPRERNRALSAPQMRLGSAKIQAMSPTLSARAPALEASGTLTASKGAGLNGASLAGTLLVYATKPGGKLDVFAAARDGQVSVLKRALVDGEKVDALDDRGLTALMWAARAGRLSTAKYLVAQGASLKRRDDSTGFSALHFAAFYCRSSVVRILVIAGADTRATDNKGKMPGACYHPLSYLSFGAFNHRREIGRFLSGDLHDVTGDKGKTMFPMNAPLEAYDEDHRPQYVRLGSSENLVATPDNRSQDSSASGDHTVGNSSSKPGAGRATRGNRRSNSRSKKDTQNKAYASMKTLPSGGGSICSNGEGDEEQGVSRRSRQGTRKAGGSNASSGVPGTSAGGAGGGIRYYLRRASVEALPRLRQLSISSQGRLSGGRGSGDPANVLADAAAIARAAAASEGGSTIVGGSTVSDDSLRLGRNRRSGRKSVSGNRGGQEQGGRRRFLMEGIYDGAKDVAAIFRGDGSRVSVSHRQSLSSRKSSDLEAIASNSATPSSRQAKEEQAPRLPDAGRSVVGGAHRLTQFRNNNNSENKNIARVVAAPPDEADAAESVVARHKHFSTTAFADDYVGAADAGAAPSQLQGESGSVTLDPAGGSAGGLSTAPPSPSPGELATVATGTGADIDDTIAGSADGRTPSTTAVVDRGKDVGRSPLTTTTATKGVIDTAPQDIRPSPVSLDVAVTPAHPPQKATTTTIPSPDDPNSLAIARSPLTEHKKDNNIVPVHLIGSGDRTPSSLPPDGDSDDNIAESATTTTVGRGGNTAVTETGELSETTTSGATPSHGRQEHKEGGPRVLGGDMLEGEEGPKLAAVVSTQETTNPARPVYNASVQDETAIEAGAAREATTTVVDEGMLGAKADMAPPGEDDDGRRVIAVGGGAGEAIPVAEADLLSSPGSSIGGSEIMDYPSSAENQVEDEGRNAAGEGGEGGRRKRERHSKGERKRHHKQKHKHKHHHNHHHRHKVREEGDYSVGSRRRDGRSRDGRNDGEGEDSSYFSPPASPTTSMLAPLKRVALPLQATFGSSEFLQTTSPDVLAGDEYSSRGAGPVGSVGIVETSTGNLVDKPAAAAAAVQPQAFAIDTAEQFEGPAFFRPEFGRAVLEGGGGGAFSAADNAEILAENVAASGDTAGG